jgi:flagellar basal-body rod modification protein FlgD
MASAVNGLSSSGATSQLAAGATTATNTAPTLNQSQFFQLLLAQMQNQDPLQPMDSSDFVTQLSQFSQLQTSQQLNTTMASFVAMQGMSQGAALIGKPVTYDPGTGVLAKGTVDSVAIDNAGNVTLQVGNQSVALSQIRSISSIKTPGTGTSTQPSS